MQYQTLKPDRIVETQRRLARRVATRFPGSGLSEVAAEVITLAEESAARAEQIRRPNWLLRGAVALLFLGALALAVRLAVSLQVRADLRDAMNLFHFAEVALRACFFLGAAILFFVSLEVRLKRRRALAALHKLRAIAHVIDMHQVAKDPEGLLRREPPASEAPAQTTRSLYDLNRYLNYCNELLAIVSKIAALYVQEFPDGPTVAAVDQVENLCSGLSQRIWQKIMILDEFLEQKPAYPVT